MRFVPRLGFLPKEPRASHVSYNTPATNKKKKNQDAGTSSETSMQTHVKPTTKTAQYNPTTSTKKMKIKSKVAKKGMSNNEQSFITHPKSINTKARKMTKIVSPQKVNRPHETTDANHPVSSYKATNGISENTSKTDKKVRKIQMSHKTSAKDRTGDGTSPHININKSIPRNATSSNKTANKFSKRKVTLHGCLSKSGKDDKLFHKVKKTRSSPSSSLKGTNKLLLKNKQSSCVKQPKKKGNSQRSQNIAEHDADVTKRQCHNTTKDNLSSSASVGQIVERKAKNNARKKILRNWTKLEGKKVVKSSTKMEKVIVHVTHGTSESSVGEIQTSVSPKPSNVCVKPSSVSVKLSSVSAKLPSVNVKQSCVSPKLPNVSVKLSSIGVNTSRLGENPSSIRAKPSSICEKPSYISAKHPSISAKLSRVGANQSSHNTMPPRVSSNIVQVEPERKVEVSQAAKVNSEKDEAAVHPKANTVACTLDVKQSQETRKAVTMTNPLISDTGTCLTGTQKKKNKSHMIRKQGSDQTPHPRHKNKSRKSLDFKGTEALSNSDTTYINLSDNKEMSEIMQSLDVSPIPAEHKDNTSLSLNTSSSSYNEDKEMFDATIQLSPLDLSMKIEPLGQYSKIFEDSSQDESSPQSDKGVSDVSKEDNGVELKVNDDINDTADVGNLTCEEEIIPTIVEFSENSNNCQKSINTNTVDIPGVIVDENNNQNKFNSTLFDYPNGESEQRQLESSNQSDISKLLYYHQPEDDVHQPKSVNTSAESSIGLNEAFLNASELNISDNVTATGESHDTDNIPVIDASDIELINVAQAVNANWPGPDGLDDSTQCDSSVVLVSDTDADSFNTCDGKDSPHREDTSDESEYEPEESIVEESECSESASDAAPISNGDSNAFDEEDNQKEDDGIGLSPKITPISLKGLVPKRGRSSKGIRELQALITDIHDHLPMLERSATSRLRHRKLLGDEANQLKQEDTTTDKDTVDNEPNDDQAKKPLVEVSLQQEHQPEVHDEMNSGSLPIVNIRNDNGCDVVKTPPRSELSERTKRKRAKPDFFQSPFSSTKKAKCGAESTSGILRPSSKEQKYDKVSEEQGTPGSDKQQTLSDKTSNIPGMSIVRPGFNTPGSRSIILQLGMTDTPRPGTSNESDTPRQPQFPSMVEHVPDLGKVVWARFCTKYWPGMIVKGTYANLAPARLDHSWVFWYGDHKISEIQKSFIEAFEKDFPVHLQNGGNVKKFHLGVLEAVKECAERCNKELDDDQGMMSWGRQGFQMTPWRENMFHPDKDHPVPNIVLEHLANIGSKQRRIQQDCNDKDSEDCRPLRIEVLQSKDPLLQVRSGQYKITDVCISCDGATTEVITQHPFFEGGLCLDCKELLMESIWIYGKEDGSNAYCTVCSNGGELFVCEKPNCHRVYCTGCITLFVGEEAVVRIQETDPWICFMCSDYSNENHGLLRAKPDWQQNLLRLFNAENILLNNDALDGFKKRPLRVLSLFDGIGTGKYVLDSMGLQVEVYYASEIEDDAIMVTHVRHGNSVIQLGDVTKLTYEKLRGLGSIDLLIGGSPCNDLSLVNPARKGLHGGTGILFFEFYRILNTLRQLNKDTTLFWMFENVAALPKETKAAISNFLMCEPAKWDAQYFSAQKRLRYFWGNIPGMYCPLLEEDPSSFTLSEMLMPNSKRTAVVDKLRTVTSMTNSLSMHSRSTVSPIKYNGQDDKIWIPELEKTFGFPAHYTDIGNLSITQRQKLLGKTWSVPVVKHLLTPLKQFFTSIENDSEENTN
ncbi:unnamed protein product [Owenia fusiformis]|uniref:DNA (cytosine-5-)-methyltransferase n=1 Tax=Owenia fusiformis TaxID=6347 RepID=A0A8J1U422_OWEFU|nr:unnamed protein product [Owenia fusiformis]